jgi:predicted glycosyltransferase
MKILVYLGHPAHFHIYRNSIKNWEKKGHKIYILIKKKDILEDLLDAANISYHNILEKGRTDSKLGIFIGMVKRAIRLFSFCLHEKPDILTGTSVENSIVGKVLGIPVVNVNEDDAGVVPYYAKLSYPLASSILNPYVCNSGKWDNKAIKLNSYHELAYLHPNHFTPDIKIVEHYLSPEKPYFLIRLAKLTAYHDFGIRGIGTTIAKHIIELLKPYGTVYITSERELEPQFEKYRIAINPLHMHHIMAFSTLYIGDSQTMAAEAGVLGVPFVRFNDFVGRIGYLNELEDVYKLGYGIKSKDVELLYKTISDLIVVLFGKSNIYQERRKKMLSEKIDYEKFLTWFIEDYPDSHKIMKKNPNYQSRFI